MAYEKTTWATGDVVTAAKLNNLENGVANASVIIVETDSENHNTLNMTAGEFFTAINSGNLIILHTVDELHNVEAFINFSEASRTESEYTFTFNNPFIVFEAHSADDYPVYVNGTADLNAE